MPGRKLLWALLFLVPAFAGVATGQRGGGKAEPLRIEFKRGASSATLSGTVRGDEEAEYVFAARKGQRVTLILTAKPAKSARFDFKVGDSPDSKFEYDGARWIGTAPVTGDYFVTVTRVSRKPGRAKYALRLAIK